jgi:HSP20 family molecular chaperone IbpA
MSQAIVQPNENSVETTNGQVLDFAPAVDIYENEQELLLYADAPGTTAEQVSVDLERDQLRIVAHATGADGTKIEYRRAFRIGVLVDSQAISATLKNGVLTVKMPKAEASRPRKIEVRAA